MFWEINDLLILHRRAEAWWPADTSGDNAVGTAFRVYFDLSYTLNTHENRITKPLKTIFVCKIRKNVRKSPRHDRKAVVGGAGLKLVKEFCPIFAFERD